MSSLGDQIVDALNQLLASTSVLHEPTFAGNEWDYVKECIDTGWVSTAGSYVSRFEEMLTEFTGVSHAIATSNGTSALHTCLLLADVEPGDEVIVPSLTFVATANAITYCGGIPHFADIDEDTLGLDPRKLAEYLNEISVQRDDGCYNQKTGRRIRTLVCMHTFGHPVDLDGILEVCKNHNLTLIEDAAESLGSYFKGQHTGNFGCLAALSFNGNKTITTGGGGAILTNDPALAIKAKHLTTTAKVPHRWEYVHDMVGFNYRMPNINAALGCAQIEQLPGFLHLKRRLAMAYSVAFKSIDGIVFFEEPANCISNYWLNVLLLNRTQAIQKKKILEHLNKAGFMSRPAWTPMHQLIMYKDCPRMDLSVTIDICSRLINIPSSSHLAVERE